MALPQIFTTTNFDPSLLPLHSYVFDANGWIAPVNESGLSSLGYNAAGMDDFLEQGFWEIGYSSLVHDVSVQFPDATYYYTIASAVTVVSGNTQTTTYYNESGIRGSNGSDVIFDVNGDDIYVTYGGDDLIVDLGGNNAIDAGSGNDVVWTLDGDDVIKAGSGDDIVMTWGGVDNVLAGGGNDLVELGDGDDFAWGNNGADTLNGGAGADALFGGGGGDRLIGGSGNDILQGDGGADIFVFGEMSGDDVITDFRRSADSIEFETAGTGLANFGDVLSAAVQSGADVVISFLDGSVTIENINLGQLNAGHFDFL